MGAKCKLRNINSLEKLLVNLHFSSLYIHEGSSTDRAKSQTKHNNQNTSFATREGYEQRQQIKKGHQPNGQEQTRPKTIRRHDAARTAPEGLAVLLPCWAATEAKPKPRNPIDN